MKKLKTKNLYKAANVIFDADEIAAWSYGHWQFVRVIRGKVVFNAYKYSTTTSKHQYRVRRLMDELGIRIDVVANVRTTLTAFARVADVNRATKHMERRIAAERAEKHRERLLRARIQRLNERGLYSAEQHAELASGRARIRTNWRGQTINESARNEAYRIMKGERQ